MSRIKNFDQFVHEGLNIDHSIGNMSSVPQIKEILSKLSNIPIFDRVKKCYSPTPEYFVENLKKEFPGIGPKIPELLGKMKSVLKMKKPERLQYLSKNWKKMISGDLSESEFLSEALPPGALELIIIGVSIIVMIIFMESSTGQVETLEPDSTQETQELMKKFSGKTINLYNDSDQRFLYGKLKISSLRWSANIEDGVQRVEMIGMSESPGVTDPDPVFFRFKIKALLNPPSISNVIILDKTFTKNVQADEADTFFNKSFTDELNIVATPWIKKPIADYGKKAIK